jgi:hypothetical protein
MSGSAIVAVTLILGLNAFRLFRLYRSASEIRPAFGQRLLLWVSSGLLIFMPFVAWDGKLQEGPLFVYYIPALLLLLFERLSLKLGNWLSPEGLLRNGLLLVAVMFQGWRDHFGLHSDAFQRAMEMPWQNTCLNVTLGITWRYALLIALADLLEGSPWVRKFAALLNTPLRRASFALLPLLRPVILAIGISMRLTANGGLFLWWRRAIQYALAHGSRWPEDFYFLASTADLFYLGSVWTLWVMGLALLVPFLDRRGALRLVGRAALAFAMAFALKGLMDGGAWAAYEASKPPVTAAPVPAAPTISPR